MCPEDLRKLRIMFLPGIVTHLVKKLEIVAKLTGRLSVDIRLRENLRLNVTMNGNTGTNKAFGEGVNPMGYATSTSRGYSCI